MVDSVNGIPNRSAARAPSISPLAQLRPVSPVGAIATGCRADLVVMNGDDVALAEHNGDALLDAAIFGPVRRPVRDVMVGGVWVVKQGHHRQEDAALQRYRAVLKKLLH